MSAAATTPTPLLVDEKGQWTILATPGATVRVHRDGTVCVMGGHEDSLPELRALTERAARLAALYQDREAHRQCGMAWAADPCADWSTARDGWTRAGQGMAACDAEIEALGYELMERGGDSDGN